MPVRKIPKNYRNVTGVAAHSKADGPAAFESTLERDFITLGKKPSLANRRLAFDRLRDREIVVKLFDEIGPRYAARNGGYLRILKCGFRNGDNAPMAFVELLDQPEAAVEAEAAAA